MGRVAPQGKSFIVVFSSILVLLLQLVLAVVIF